jgi:hypothetical protein
MTNRRRVGLVLLVLAPVAVVAVVLRDFVREELVGPVLYVYWIVRLLFESIPQIWLWIAFVLAATYVVARSLVRPPSLQRTCRADVEERGRVETWARLLHQAHGDSFARWRLAQRLGGLAGDILAAEERVSQREIWRRLDRGRLDVPAPLRAYLTAQFRTIRPAGLRGRLRQHSSPLDLDPREVVAFLETRTGHES